MRIKKLRGLIQIIFGLIISSIFLTSCSNFSPSTNTPSSSQTIDGEIPVTNVTTQTLNEKLGNIKDEETALDAVNSFVEYVATRFEEPESSGLTSQSGTSESNADFLKQYFNIDQVAQMELNFRTKGLTTQSGDNSGGLTSPEELAEQINEYDTSGDQVNVKEIETIRDAIRMAMPNIAPDKRNPLMSQLEAHAVGWAYMTGDDGTMAANSLKLGKPLPDLLSQARQNKEEITAQGACVIAFVVITILQGIDYTKAVMTREDLFGNKVSDDQEKIYFVKIGRRKEPRPRWEPVAKYYRLSDLEDAAAEVRNYLTLDYGSNPNGLALIDNVNNDGIAIASGPGGLSIQSNNFIDFPYSSWKSVMRKGDLIFKKSSRHDIVTDMSYLSHVAMFYTHEVGTEPAKVYESISYGANIYNLGVNWVNLDSGQPDNYLFSLRRIGNTSESTIASAVDSSVSRHAGKTKFRPDIHTPNGGTTQPEFLTIGQKISYYREWADKNSSSSAYCSKLVWLTFKDVQNNSGNYIDLDSNATRAKLDIWQSWGLMAPDKGVLNAFIGVSPDDIYESPFLDPFFFYYKDSFLEITQGG